MKAQLVTLADVPSVSKYEADGEKSMIERGKRFELLDNQVASLEKQVARVFDGLDSYVRGLEAVGDDQG
eukprot:12402932-Karenia_brevis.AAC.1